MAVIAFMLKVGMRAVPAKRLVMTMGSRDWTRDVVVLESVGRAAEAQDQKGQHKGDEYSGSE